MVFYVILLKRLFFEIYKILMIIKSNRIRCETNDLVFLELIIYETLELTFLDVTFTKLYLTRLHSGQSGIYALFTALFRAGIRIAALRLFFHIGRKLNGLAGEFNSPSLAVTV